MYKKRNSGIIPYDKGYADFIGFKGTKKQYYQKARSQKRAISMAIKEHEQSSFFGYASFWDFLFGESYKTKRTRELKKGVYKARSQYSQWKNKKYPGDGKDMSISQRYYGSRSY